MINHLERFVLRLMGTWEESDLLLMGYHESTVRLVIPSSQVVLRFVGIGRNYQATGWVPRLNPTTRGLGSTNRGISRGS